MKKIGFFGGTFDPIHFGHLNLALELSEKHHLDEVLFCPAKLSPFKKERPPVAQGEERKTMTLLGIEPIPQFKLCKIELEKEGPSYTIDTLRELHQKGVQLYLLLSNEAIKNFHQWKEPEEILRLASPLVGCRLEAFFETPSLKLYREGLKNREVPRRRPEFESGKADAEADKLKKFIDAGGSQSLWLSDAGRTDSSITSGINRALKEGVTQTRQMEISSTEIRARLKKGLTCCHLVPTKALDYIQKHHLYS